MSDTFGQRLHAALDLHGALCVGIDPHAALLSAWGLDATASGARDFGLRVVEAARGRVGVVKPQVAFYERYGSRGFAALELRAAILARLKLCRYVAGARSQRFLLSRFARIGGGIGARLPNFVFVL